MGKSWRRIDGIDIATMLTAIQAVHAGRVELSVLPDGLGFSPSVMVRLTATFDALPGSNLPTSVMVENPWPCKEHEDLIAHMYDGLYRLDAAIQLAYEQAKLPGV